MTSLRRFLACLGALSLACGPASPPVADDDALLVDARDAIDASDELPAIVAELEGRGCSWDVDASTLVVDHRHGASWGIVFDAFDCASLGRRAVPMVLARRPDGAPDWEVAVGAVVSDEPYPGGEQERMERALLLVDDATGAVEEFPMDAANVQALREWYAALPAPTEEADGGDVGGSSMGISEVAGFRQLSTSCGQALGLPNAAGGTCCQCMSDAQACLTYQAMTPEIAVDCYRTLVCNGGTETTCENGRCGERAIATPQDWGFAFDLDDEVAAGSCDPGDASCREYDELCDPYRLSGDFASTDLTYCREVYQGFDIGALDRGEYPTFSGQVTQILSTASLVISVINPVAGAAGVTLTTVTGIGKVLGPLKSLFGLADQTTGNFDRLNRDGGDGSIWGEQGIQIYCGDTDLSYSNCHLPLCLTSGGFCLEAHITCNEEPEVGSGGERTCADGEVVDSLSLGVPSAYADFDWCCTNGLHFEYLFPGLFDGFDGISLGGINSVGQVHTPGFECVFHYPSGTTLPATSWGTHEGSFTPGTGPSWSQVEGAHPDNFTCTWAPRPVEMDGEAIVDLDCGGGP